jgi:two-component system, OmpR family, response regulator ChvI
VAEEISFIGGSQNCCVCFIDIVDSTRITTVEILDSEKIKIYYSVFINTMAAIVRNFDGTIIKNTGDSLIYYFPKTMGRSGGNVTNLKSVFECGLTMLAVHPIMNVKLKEKGLPDLSYRISADYGKVEIAKSLTSTSEDLFGPVVNLCSKINSKASPNQMVIGNNLYQIIKSTLGNNEYRFNMTDEYSIDSTSRNQYPIYSVFDKSRKNNNRAKIYEYIV